MSPTDFGADLWALVHHLYSKFSSSGDAFRELTLRTGIECTASDLKEATTLANIRKTTWYRMMCTRHQCVRQAVEAKHADDAAEAKEIIKSLYPHGCHVSDFADVTLNCSAMLPVGVPNELVMRFIHSQGEHYHAEDVHELTAEQLTTIIIQKLMLESLVPVGWWRSSAQQEPLVTPKRIALRAKPPEIAVEYERPAGVTRQRRIRLSSLLSPSGPTAPLARRLVATHDALLSEADLQRILLKLQRLLLEAEEEHQRNVQPADTASQHSDVSLSEEQTGPVDSAQREDGISGAGATSSSPVPQKADLGLLYRDPERALQNVDLNDADEITLKEFKAVMEERFKATALKPGDPGYVYDKRVVTERPVSKSEWDDSDSD